jgi:hypothetical protein
MGVDKEEEEEEEREVRCFGDGEDDAEEEEEEEEEKEEEDSEEKEPPSSLPPLVLNTANDDILLGPNPAARFFFPLCFGVKFLASAESLGGGRGKERRSLRERSSFIGWSKYHKK